MNMDKIKRLSSNHKLDKANNKTKQRPLSTRKTNTYKNADLNLQKNQIKKDLSKTKSQFDKYS